MVEGVAKFANETVSISFPSVPLFKMRPYLEEIPRMHIHPPDIQQVIATTF